MRHQNRFQSQSRFIAKAVWAVWAVVVLLSLCAGGNAAAADAGTVRVIEMEGTVEYSPAGGTSWSAARTNQDLHPLDQVRTGPKSRVAFRWSDQSVMSFGASTELEILAPEAADAEAGLHLIRGIASFFHRDAPGRLRVITRGAVAGVEGTDFVVDVNDTDRTTVSVIDGKVRLGNDQSTAELTNGQEAYADVGQAPARTPGFVANNLLQWSFYYPAVIDLADLSFTPEQQTALADSIAAYRAGDLLAALASYPAARRPASDDERIYYAGLLLAVGQTDAPLPSGAPDQKSSRLAEALRMLVAAVKHQKFESANPPQLASEFLARSYYEQSLAVPRVSLEKALDLASKATALSPQFGFAWERLAELEFSFGRVEAALDALDRSLVLSPRNAQALALKGFLLAARNRTKEAETWFNRAIEADSALGNAWLGRGLCRIRSGDANGGREDLLAAAALEPQRAELRSYLGKAYANIYDEARARKELALAEKLDPADPTPWLYLALVDEDENRVNDAIRNLEKSEKLNDNRGVYRSEMLLDEDRAVRSDNLAEAYGDAGLTDPATREALRAVNAYYADYSAHLFLANTYNQLVDPDEIALRYETARESEYLLANLLSPAAAGVLSPTLSQQEYTRMFDGNRLGVTSQTEYLSRGAWSEAGAQYGIVGDFSYDLEANYSFDPGQQVNNDFQQRSLTATMKQQLTPADSLYLQVLEYEANGGDLHQYYSPSMASPTYRFTETQEPTIAFGYQHEWNPGIHTVFVFGRINDDYQFQNPTEPTLLAFPHRGAFVTVDGIGMNEVFASQQDIYSGELQHIWQTAAHNTIIGGRLQYGDFYTANVQNDPSGNLGAQGLFAGPPTNAVAQSQNTYFARGSVYGYHDWQIADPLQLFAGLTYDWMKFPANAEAAPISSAEETTSRVSPKAGFIFTPMSGTTVRLAYTRSMGGASLDQSFQIEPTQVAGFLQSFRSLIPESVAPESPGAGFETYGVALEQKLETGTYLAIEGDMLNSKVGETTGFFNVNGGLTTYPIPAGTPENLDYHENSLLFTADQLLGKDWAVGAQYQISVAELDDTFPEFAHAKALNDFEPHQQTQAILHGSQLFVTYNNPTGFFASGQALWNGQENSGYSPALAADSFWQFNAFAGYRFDHRKAELRLGLLNLGNQNYNLNPLNLYPDYPRKRTLDVRLLFNF